VAVILYRQDRRTGLVDLPFPCSCSRNLSGISFGWTLFQRKKSPGLDVNDKCKVPWRARCTTRETDSRIIEVDVDKSTHSSTRERSRERLAIKINESKLR
jgi:hypothetical protein